MTYPHIFHYFTTEIKSNPVTVIQQGSYPYKDLVIAFIEYEPMLFIENVNQR
jgi:hypothetical protein